MQEAIAAEVQKVAASPQKSATSTLGSTNDIRARMESSGILKSETSQSTEKKTEQAPETSQEEKVKKDSLPIQPKEEVSKAPLKDGTDGMTPEQRKMFIEAKEKQRDAEKEVKRLTDLSKEFDLTKKERDELKTAKEDLEKLRKRDEAEIAAVRLRSTDRYKKEILYPKIKLMSEGYKDIKGNEHKGAIPKLCEQLKISFSDIQDVIYSEDEVVGDQKLDEVFRSSEAPSSSRRRLEQMINDVRKLEYNESQLEEDAPKAWEAIQLEDKKSKEEFTKKEQETYKLAFSATKDILLDRIPFLKGEDGKIDPEAEKAFKEAEGIDFQNLPPDLKSAYVQSGHLLQVMRSVVDKKDEEISRLRESVKRLGGKPGPDSAKGPKIETKNESEDDPKKRSRDPGKNFMAWREGKLQ